MKSNTKKLFFNREISWLEFNYRVLEEALDKNKPILERLKFLSIFSSNLDEFFMVRIANLITQEKDEYQIKDDSGLTPKEILEKLEIRIKELVAIQYDCYNNDIKKELEKNGFYFYTAKDIPKEYINSLKNIFIKKLYLTLTPMGIDQSHPFPFITNKSLNIFVKLQNPKTEEILYAMIPYPSQDRFIHIPNDHTNKKFIFIGELLKLFVSDYFTGYKVIETVTFRITRNAELDIDEEDTKNLLSEIEKELKERERGTPIRLEIGAEAGDDIIQKLKENLKFDDRFCFRINGPIDLSSFSQIVFSKDYYEYKDEPLIPVLPYEFQNREESIFDIISKKDRLLFLPYESFDPVVRFIEEAAIDPKVLAIKMTLYRTSGDSPIVKALQLASDNKKQVTVLVELKARFDEAQNISWARTLEEAGCHVVYGLVGLKTHCKIALVVREEDDGIKRYIHLSTGNYNDKTAKIYTDIGLFTTRRSFGRDISAIFNLLTGYSEPPRWKKLISAPLDLRNFFIERINIEKNNVLNGGKGLIIAKMNALVDTKIIECLYEASKVGVEIILIVRGMCSLVPGIEGLSEKVKVISIVDRFLEHSRIYYFYNSGEENIYLSSADWMERNFDRRVEVLFPIEDSDLKKEINKVLKIILSDNVKARILRSDGKYERVIPKKNEKLVQSQLELYNFFKEKNQIKINDNKKFIPVMNPDKKI